MKSIFDPSTREELISRINAVTPQHAAQWGKMNVIQMLHHCRLSDDMMFGDIKIKRVLIGRLIGPGLLRKVLRDDRVFGKDSPTASVLKTTAFNGDISKEKSELATSIARYSNFTNDGFVHPFFGPMTREQIGQFVYKHADHHLRQFGA